jgi:hypothetical protein
MTDILSILDKAGQTELGNSVRAEVAKILARFSGLDIAAVKVSTLKNVASVLDAEDMRAKACTCGAHVPQFEPAEKPDEGRMAPLHFARINRLRADDELANQRGVL